MKNFLVQLKLFFLSMIRNPRETLIFYKNLKGETIYDNDKHIELAANWLLKAQEVGNDNGYSRGFYLYKNGWDKSYIETTGYIIPTLLNVYQYTKEEKYKESALKAGEWLLEIQKQNGAFTDIDRNVELVFDTGQVLYGLIAIYELNEIEITLKIKNKYKDAIYKASHWICSVQDQDGSWTKYGFHGKPHSYYSRVASILYKSGILLNNNNFKECANKNINWVLSNQLENGFFDKLKFDTEESFLHTMIYVLEGLYDYYLLTKNEVVLDALFKNANKLNELNNSREILLCSQYDINFNCVNSDKCITGLAQWALLAFKLYELTNDVKFLKNAIKTLYYLKSKQFKENENLKGALPGSVPFWGIYAPFSAVNWGVKFFIDALLEYNKHKLPIMEEKKFWLEKS